MKKEMKSGKVVLLIVNIVLLAVMLIHCAVNVAGLASDASNSAPAWTGVWVCLPYIAAIILVNAAFALTSRRKKENAA